MKVVNTVATHSIFLALAAGRISMPDEQPSFWMDDEPENLTFDSQKYINDLVKEELKAGNFTIEGVDPDILDDVKFLVKQGLENDEIDPFADDAATEAAKLRHAARKTGATFGESKKPGYQAFTPTNKSLDTMVSEWAQHGNAEVTGGKPKKKALPDDRPLIKDFLKSLWPDCIEVRNEEKFEIILGGPSKGMVVKRDRDGFIDFSIQFHDRAEIAIQATTVSGESQHMKKFSVRKRKAGDNVHKWLTTGRKLYMVLTSNDPGPKGVRYSWQKVGRYQRVACIYEITAEMLQASRDRREKLAASKAEKFKNRKKTL